MFGVTNEDIAKAKQEYEYYLAGKSGSFTTALIDAIHLADFSNFRILASAYPEYCYIVANVQKTEHLKLFNVIA